MNTTTEAPLELAQESQALQRMQSAPPPTLAGVNIEALLSKAVDANSAVDVLERLAVMRREMKAEAAKEAFDSAMAQFQAECPVIGKDAAVYDKSGKVRYRYATIDGIVSKTKDLIQKHGFSYRVTAKVEGNFVTAICKVVHYLGHCEESEFKVPIDPDSYMNQAQKFASALTFAKRYAFCNAFGILTGDADDDAQSSDPEHAAGQGKRMSSPPPTQQHAPPAATRTAPAPAPATAHATTAKRLPTVKTRDWAISKLVSSPVHAQVLLEFLQKAGALLPTENSLQLWPLQHVPASETDLEALRKALAGFESGEPAKMPFYHGDAVLSDTPPETPKAAPKAKKPVEVPRDPDAGDQSTAPVEIDPTWEKVMGKVSCVSVKNGTNSRVPWTCYGIKIGEDWYNTFSKRVGQIAQSASGKEVDLYYSETEKGKTAEHIEA